MGSTGAARATGGNIRPSGTTPEVVKDDFGRDVVVIRDIKDLPSDRQLWSSGAFGKSGDYYIVFAKYKSDYEIDKGSLVGLKTSLTQMSAVRRVGGWKSWKTSAEADKWIRRYDARVRKSAQLERDLVRAKQFATALRNIGL